MRVRPIVEYLPLDPVESRQAVNWEMFTEIDDHTRRVHQYYSGVKQDLLGSNGIYVFYDSRGKALYAGKAKDQSLWKEMTSAYNRKRPASQHLTVADHPVNNVPYRRSDEKLRQIRKRDVRLYDLAEYVSAYCVANEDIDVFEALLIRCFANDLLNTRIEKIPSS